MLCDDPKGTRFTKNSGNSRASTITIIVVIVAVPRHPRPFEPRTYSTRTLLSRLGCPIRLPCATSLAILTPICQCMHLSARAPGLVQRGRSSLPAVIWALLILVVFGDSAALQLPVSAVFAEANRWRFSRLIQSNPVGPRPAQCRANRRNTSNQPEEINAPLFSRVPSLSSPNVRKSEGLSGIHPKLHIMQRIRFPRFDCEAVDTQMPR